MLRRLFRTLVSAAVLLAGVSTPAWSGGYVGHGYAYHGHGYEYAGPRAGLHYRGEHGSLFLGAPSVRTYRYDGYRRYFGQPGTVIIERRYLVPGYRWEGAHERHRHHRGGVKTFQCGPSVCVRIR